MTPRKKVTLEGDLGQHEDESVDRAEVIERKAARRASVLADDLRNDRELAEVVAADLSEDRLVAAQIATDLADTSKHNSRFQRALYVMFIVVGLLAAFSYDNARDANNSLKEAQRGLNLALANQEAQRLVNEAVAVDASADRDRIAATAEGSKARAAALERLVITLLANTNDPDLKRAFREFAVAQGINTDGPPSSPSPSASPSR